MSATGTVSVQPIDGAAGGGFVRGFACCPGAPMASHASATQSPEPAAVHEPPPEFRLTTVLPGVAVEIEVGAFTRE